MKRNIFNNILSIFNRLLKIIVFIGGALCVIKTIFVIVMLGMHTLQYGFIYTMPKVTLISLYLLLSIGFIKMYKMIEK